MHTIPLDVPSRYRRTFRHNYDAITHSTDRLFLFAADHKMEKLDPIKPEDLFIIGASPHIGACAMHLGLIARYGASYRNINYIVKLNGKSDIVPTSQKDPCSRSLWSVAEVIRFQEASGLNIRGVGYTIYLGSESEANMLSEAAQAVSQAHQYGLVAMLWIYPRGKAVRNETAVNYGTGAAGVATSLGADFVKIKVPHAAEARQSAELLSQVVASAGNTKVLCAGGEVQPVETLLRGVYENLHVGGVAGVAIGRNIFKHDFAQAMNMVEAVSAMVYHDKTVEQVMGTAGK